MAFDRLRTGSFDRLRTGSFDRLRVILGIVHVVMVVVDGGVRVQLGL